MTSYAEHYSRRVVYDTGFVESGDARFMLPDMKEMFGSALGESDVATRL
jgi:hypothetical protein